MYSPLIDIFFGDFIISKKYIYGTFIFIELTLFTNLFQDKKYLLQLYKALHPEDTDVTGDQNYI